MIDGFRPMADDPECYWFSCDEMLLDPPDLTAAYEYLLDGVDDEHGRSCYALATWYFFGKHVERDFANAAELLEIAAARGVVGAMMQLAECYECGIGVAANAERADALRGMAQRNGTI